MGTILGFMFIIGLGILFFGLCWLLFNLIKKHQLRISGIVTITGLIVTIISFVFSYYYTYSDTNNANDYQGTGNYASSDSDTSKDTTPETSSSESKEILSLNQEYKNKNFGIKVTQADQNFNEHGRGLVNDDIFKLSQENGVQITIDYTNYDMTSFLPSIFDFTVYDDGNKTAKILNQQDGQDAVSKGRTGTTTFWVNLQKPYSETKYIEIEYSNSDVIFRIPLNH